MKVVHPGARCVDRDRLSMLLAARIDQRQRNGFTLMIAFIRHKLGLPAPDVSFMAAGRIVGWCAHALEQFHTRDLVRPRSAYVGPLPSTT